MDPKQNNKGELTSDNYYLNEMAFCPTPGCTQGAEVLKRFVVQSTDGPIEFIRTRCFNMHIQDREVGRQDAGSVDLTEYEDD